MSIGGLNGVRIIITGGAGFIGSNLARLALHHGAQVVVVDDLSTGSLTNLAGLDVEFREASVLDPQAMSAALAGMTA